MIDFIITIDYELFGNGGGDVQRDIVEPTDRLLAICDRHAAKLTIMFEMGQYWAMKDAEELRSRELGYSPAKAMETQLRRVIGSGHDVQLHLHPQWIGAEYQGGLWRLNFDQIRVCDLDNVEHHESGALSLGAILRRGKETLESLLKPVDPDYECIAFRAGGFYIEPAGGAIEAMRSAGLWADTSVVPGYVVDYPCPADFRCAPRNSGVWWTNRRSVVECGQEGEGLLEFPVYSEMKPYLCNFKPAKLIATLKRRAIEKRDPHCRVHAATQSVSSLRSVMTKLLSKNAIKFDICKLSAGDMCRMFASAVEKQTADTRCDIYPVVCLGHSKDFWNEAALDEFFRRISSYRKYRSKFRWNTLGGVVQQIRSAHPGAVEVGSATDERPGHVSPDDISKTVR